MTAAQLFARLMRECAAFPGRLAVAAASLLVLSGAQLYMTWIVKRWTDGPLAGDMSHVGPLLAAGVAVTAVMIGAVFVSRYVLSGVDQRLVQRLRDAALGRLLILRLPAARRYPRGELASRIMNDAGMLSGFVREVMKRLLGEGLVIVGALAMAVMLDWKLALGTCAVVPLVVFLLDRLGRAIRRRGASAQAEIGNLGATLNEQLTGLTTIKGFETEAFEQNRFVDQNVRYRRVVMRTEWWSSLLITGVWIATGLGLWAILWYGTRQVLAGEITAGTLLAVSLYVLQTLEPLRRLGEVQGMLQRTLAGAARIYEIVECDEVERGGGRLLPQPRGVIRFEDVHFRYRDDAPVLQGLTLELAPGEPVALVAASGGGKSTLAGLLVRFADPQAGCILLDGIDLRILATPALRRAVCVVEQEPFVFSGRLIDNVRYGSWDASRRRVEEAIALAGLDALVGALPAGLYTPVAEAGHDLSGGQKQRLALARAIVRDPAVLVLDEATSALDSETEGRIFARLEPWLRRRTTLVMAHRLSTVARFARVIVLEHGRVAGDGPVTSLFTHCAAFAKLFAEQGIGNDASRPPAAASG